MRYQQFYLMNLSMVESVYPWLFPGHKFVLVPTSVAGCYVILYSSEMFHENPKEYTFFLLVTVSILIFELTYFWMSTQIYLQGKEVQGYFTRLNWRTLKPFGSRYLYHGLPKHAGLVRPFKDWNPAMYLMKVAKATVKLRLYSLN